MENNTKQSIFTSRIPIQGVTTDRSITIMRTSDVKELILAIKSIPGDPEELLDIDGVRLLLGGGGGKLASKSAINNWRRDGYLPFIKIGKGRNAAVRYKRKDILESLEKFRVVSKT